MTLVTTVRRAARLLDRCNPRWVYDYDAPDLPLATRLERLHQALSMARRRCSAPASGDELSYALADCDAMLATVMGSGVPGPERIEQRTARMRSVLAYHEGRFDRLNRRYWWVPFLFVLIPMLARGCPELLSLFM